MLSFIELRTELATHYTESIGIVVNRQKLKVRGEKKVHEKLIQFDEILEIFKWPPLFVYCELVPYIRHRD